MSASRKIRTSTGRPIVLRSELGRGGEGTVYEIDGDIKLAAKIYHPEKASERREKLLSMVQANWHAQASNVAFPIDALFDSANQFAGFTMPRVGGHKPIERLYSPTSRKTDFPGANFAFLLRVGLNIARALANVNATGCVVGDINHSGVLVSNDATVTLIDCDSFQVSSNGKLFHCKVGVSEFTPPELQGKRLDQIVRTSNHDSFGLAVLLFSLLFMGRHPFAGKYLGKGDMPMETAIAQFRFAYSARKSETRMEPPPSVPLLADIPQALANAFEIAFGPPGVSVGRPKPSDWVALLEDAERSILTCRTSPAHQHFRSAKSCPWCAMEKAYPGFIAFSPAFPPDTGTPVDLGQLIAAVSAVQDPGTANPLRTLMPAFSGAPSPPPALGNSNWKARYLSGLVGAVCSLEMLYWNAPVPLIGVIGLAASVWWSFRQWDVLDPYKKKTAQAFKTFDELERKWQQVSDNRPFKELGTKTNGVVRQFQSLGTEESKEIADLKLKQREQQLTSFLERFHIQHATIKGIGNARKLTLVSYGIETAADVSAQRINRISGFGPAMTGAIMAWRISVERRFAFDPNQPINPSDVALIKTKYTKKRTDLQAELRECLTKLRATSSNIVQIRHQLKDAAIPVWQSLKQAEMDEQAVQRQLPSTLHKWGFGIVLFFAFSIIASINSPVRKGTGLPDGASSTESHINSAQARIQPNALVAPPPLPKFESKPTAAATARKDGDKAIFDSRLMPPPVEPAPFKWPEPAALGNGGATANSLNAAPGLTSDSQAAGTSKQSGQPMPIPPLDPPIEIAPPPDPPGTKQARSLNSPEDVRWIQLRLVELGYLKTPASSIWDMSSRLALRDFKITNKFANKDVWDLDTEKQLGSASALNATESFIGSWSENTPCDPSQAPPMVITSRRATSSAGGFCDFLSISSDNGGWRIRTRCSDAGRRWSYDVRFSMSSGQLVWDGKSGRTIYFRCS